MSPEYSLLLLFCENSAIAVHQKKHVLGAECCNWSEYTWGRYDLQWKMWPRTCALAENLWTKPEDPYNGRWPFMKRVWVQCERLRKMGVNCATVR